MLPDFGAEDEVGTKYSSLRHLISVKGNQEELKGGGYDSLLCGTGESSVAGTMSENSGKEKVLDISLCSRTCRGCEIFASAVIMLLSLSQTDLEV